MRIKNRLSPYPILDNFGDDYIESSFTVEYDVKTQFSEVIGRLIFRLDNEDVEKLIKNNHAVYAVHIECPSTCYREVYSSTDTEISFRLDAFKVSKVIEIRTFIVLTSDVKAFTSTKFHPDYLGRTFDLSEHQILAIGTAKNYDVQNDGNDLEAFPSIIQVRKMIDKGKGTLSVNTDIDDHIIIGLTEEVYDLYTRLGKSTFKASVFGLILFPALIIVLQRMYIYRDDDVTNTMHWFKVIESMLTQNGINLADLDVSNDKLLSVCQSIFADPITRSFKELELCSERM